MVKQISLRLPDGLHEQLKLAAESDRRSLHAEIIWLLEQSQSPEGQGE
jgi:hypothetical protein